MSAKTSQLQIRVSPDEKAALKRLARAAGESVSQYVLNRVLPSAELALAALMDRLRAPDDDLDAVLSELARALHRLPADQLSHGVPAPDADVSLARLNRVAGLVEAEAGRQGVDPPVWAWELPLLERPVFRWALPSLKPHQMRVTPVPFKRRNVFFDPASGPAAELVGGSTPLQGIGAPGDTALLSRLEGELAGRGVIAELYLVGGAVLVQALASDPGTANVDAMFRPMSQVTEALRAVAAREGAPDAWHHETVRAILGGPRGVGVRRFVELPHVRVFTPLPEYVLALKCAAMRLGADFGEMDDVRYLLRAMNIRSADAALTTVAPYFTARQLPGDIHERLSRLLPG